MKQENLNEIRNIYLNIATGGEGPEVLSEGFGPFLSQAEKDDINRKMRQGRAQQPVKAPKEPSSGTELQKALAAPTLGYDPDKGTTGFGTKQKGYTPKILAPLTIGGEKIMGAMEPGKRNTWRRAEPGPVGTKRYNALKDARRFEAEKDRLKNVGNKTETAAQIDARVAALNAKKETQRPAAGTPAAGTPAAAPVTQRPAASGPVLSKKDGVEGTGVGANFNKKAFTDTERTRYSSVAAQNAARTPAASGTPPKPVASTAPPTATTADKIKGGLSNYQSQVKSGDVKGAEETGKSTFALANPRLAAAQAEKDRIRGTSQTDNPLMKDMRDRMPMTPSVQSPTLAKDLGVGTPSGSGNQSLLNNPNANKSPIINNKKPITPPVTQNNSYQWPSAKTIREIAGAYSSIYEAKKQVDQDEDGDNDFADNMIARMVASGMSREEAIKKVKNKDYNKKDELDEGIGRSKPKQSRGEELRSKYGSPARFGRPPRTPSGETTKTRYDITLNSSGKEAADKVHRAAFNMLGIAPRDDGSHKPGTVTSGDYRGEGNSANRRMGNPPEDTRPMGIESQVKQGHINSRGVKKPLARSINADFEMWVDGLLSEGYDLSEYTWNEMSEIYFDEATKMRKELGKEGEIETRKEFARRSNAYQRSGSVDNTIAAAERGADRPYVANIRGESDADRATRQREKSKTLEGLAISRRSSVRDKPRAGLRGYAAKVEGSDRDLQSARSSAMAAGTLTPREKKQLNMEAYAAYEFVASYLLENNFASTVNDANVIINNMSEGWFNQIIQG